MGSGKREPAMRSTGPSEVLKRFETAVFLIGVGLNEKDASYESDPGAYPYSGNFRHGLNIFAALCAECSGDAAAEILKGMNESGFIRGYCTKDVREWVADWDDEPRAAALSSAYADLGPLVQLEEGFFVLTSDCWDLIFHAESDVLGAYQERKVYEFLRAGSQEQYTFGRRLLIRHPVLSWDELSLLKTGRYDFSADPLDRGEFAVIDQDWLVELIGMAYEQVPDGMKRCPRCGWTMGRRGRQPYCSSPACRDGLPANLDSLEDVARGSVRLSRGVMRYISLPGDLETAIAEFASDQGLDFQMWPMKDTCDLLVILPQGKKLAIDAKTHGSAARLAKEIGSDDLIGRVGADEVVYVIPDEVERSRPGFCAECNHALSSKAGYSCVTFKTLRARIVNAGKEAR